MGTKGGGSEPAALIQPRLPPQGWAAWVAALPATVGTRTAPSGGTGQTGSLTTISSVVVMTRMEESWG